MLLGLLLPWSRGYSALSPGAAAGNLPRVTTAAELWALPDAEKTQPHWAEIEITASYYDPDWKLLWGTDRGGAAYYPLATVTPRLRAGQRFIVSGKFVPAEGLQLATAKITILDENVAPEPLPTHGHILDAEQFNGGRVVVEGYVNSQTEIHGNHLVMELAVEGCAVTARTLIEDNIPVPQVQGALVRLVGVYVCEPNTTPRHPNIWIARPQDITVLDWLDRDPRFKTPVTPIDQIPSASALSLLHVAGVVQAQKPGDRLVLRDATGEITLHTAMTRAVGLGTRVEAIGYPGSEGITAVLRQCLYRPATTQPVASSPQRGLPMLRLADQVRRLSTEDAERHFLARLHGVVTWSHPGDPLLYLMDSSGGVAVRLPAVITEIPGPGWRLEITGRSVPGSFAPELEADTVKLLDSAALPDARIVTLDQLLTGVEEGQWVSLGGYVRKVHPGEDYCRLTVATSAGDFVAVVPPGPRSEALEGTVVQLQGVCRAVTDRDHQLTSVELWVAGHEYITVIEAKPRDPFAEPLRTVASLRRFNALNNLNHRVHVAGVVSYNEPGRSFFMEDEGQSLQVLSRDGEALKPGDRAESVGFPGREGDRLVLREAVYRKIGHGEEPPSSQLDAPGKLKPALDGRLVHIDAGIIEIATSDGGTRFVCAAEGTIFDALLVGVTAAHLPKNLAVGCDVRLKGVYALLLDQGSRPRGFRLRLRSADDLVILRETPWWTARRIGRVLGVLGGFSLLGFAWIFALRRRVRKQTTQIREQLEKSARLEAELARSARLESLGVLAGGIAHDFNNLLTVILGNISLVILGHKVEAEDETFLRESERAGLRARDLTQQLLTFAKGGAPVRSAVLLPDIVREATGFALHGSRVRGDFDFAQNLWTAHVDRGQISQVVHNIAINAVHAMPTGGALRLALCNEEVREGSGLPLAAGRYLKLSIRDTGIGISPEHLSRIFDPYFTTKQQGSGLGLATVYSIIRKHGGHITVESQLGRGTTFHIWLPATTDAPEAGASAAAAAIGSKLSGRVLVMDDEAPVREVASAMLRRLGLEVATAPDGEAAVRMAREARDGGRPFALVILDLTVPDAMGGKDALVVLREIDPAVRAIVCSGYSDDPVVANYREHGFQGRVPKPYEFAQLAKVLNEVLGGLEAAAGAGTGRQPNEVTRSA